MKNSLRTLQGKKNTISSAVFKGKGYARVEHTLGVTWNSPFALSNHVLNSLGDFRASLSNIIKLYIRLKALVQPNNSKGEEARHTVSSSKDRASSMFFKVLLRFPSSDSILVEASLADETCTSCD